MENDKKRPLMLPEHTVYFDVDDTLIFWILPKRYDGPKVKITYYEKNANPYGRQKWTKTFPINTAAVEALKEHKKQGHNVIVWSQGGADWAWSVVYSLKLLEYVDVIVDKPSVCYDDLPPRSWMPMESKHPLPDGWEMKMSGLRWLPSRLRKKKKEEEEENEND